LWRCPGLAEVGDENAPLVDLGAAFAVGSTRFTLHPRWPRADFALRSNELFGGGLYASCGQEGKAKSRFELAATQLRPNEIVCAYLSARKLPGFDQGQWQQRLESARESALSFSQTSSLPGWWFYNCGLISTALGHAADAEAEFRSALLMPDHLLSYHFTRLALAHRSP